MCYLPLLKHTWKHQIWKDVVFLFIFRPWAGYRPPSPRWNFVHYDFLQPQYIRHKIKDVSPLSVAALTCNITLYTLPSEIALNVSDNYSTLTCSYIFACWHICIWTSYNTVTYFSINFINALSYYRFIHYLVFPALFPSIGMVFINHTCISSVTDCSKSIRLLLKEFKVLYYGHLHYFPGPCYVRYPQNSIKHSS